MLGTSIQRLLLALAVSMNSLQLCKAEPPNPLHDIYPFDITMVYNFTLFIIPYPKESAQALAGYPLRTPPFPMPEGTAPLMLQFGKDTDVGPKLAQIEKLMTWTVSVPYVDRVRDGKSPFSLSKYSFQDNLLTSALASLAGYPTGFASFTPANEAYSTNQGVSSLQIKTGILNQTPAFDAVWTPLQASQTPTYDQSVYEKLTNGPIFGDKSWCGTVDHIVL